MVEPAFEREIRRPTPSIDGSCRQLPTGDAIHFLDVEAKRTAQERPRTLFLVRRELQRAAFDGRIVQPSPVQRAMFDIAQLALNPPLEAGAARAGDLAAETFAAGVVDAIPRFAPNMVDAEIRPVETLALTRAAIARDAVAPRRGPPPRPSARRASARCVPGPGDRDMRPKASADNSCFVPRNSRLSSVSTM